MTAKTFRILVAAEILLIIGIVVCAFATHHQLPEELKRYDLGAEDSADTEIRTGEWILVFGAVSIAALLVISMIGLLFLWRPARLLYTLSYVAGIPILLFSGPSVSTAITETVTELSSFLSGVIWALLYFSPIKQYFETDPDAPVL